MTESLLRLLGLYGGTLALGFLAGMFPLLSVELFLGTYAAVAHPAPAALALMIVLAAIGHQVAKTVCYVAGAGAMAAPKGRLKKRIDAAQRHIDRWNKHPWLVMVLASTVGLPPLFALAFVAGPMMRIRFVPFTAICFAGRLARYSTVALVPLLF